MIFDLSEKEKPTIAFILSLIGGIFILLGGGMFSITGSYGFGGIMNGYWGYGGMMGGYGAAGVIMPEPGPNMMWNTKYSSMANGVMGYRNQASLTISISQAQQLAQAYLDSHFTNAKTEMATAFYGYYTFDFTVGGNVAGMLSVNAYSGSVWYHSWHGAYIQEVEFT